MLVFYLPDAVYIFLIVSLILEVTDTGKPATTKWIENAHS